MLPRVPKLDAGRAGVFLRRSPTSTGIGPFPGRTGRVVPVFAGEADDLVDADLGPVRLVEEEALPADPEGGTDAPPASLDELRRVVARMEGRLVAGARLSPMPQEKVPQEWGRPARARAAALDASRLGLGVAGFDGLFAGGGLLLPALTEIRGPETRLAGALTGFLAALIASLSGQRGGPVLWICERRTVRETGTATGLGLVHLGLDPARLLLVHAGDAADALWAAEEGLGCPGLSAVVAELHGLPRAFDLTASRRLSLRAREGGVPMLLAGHAMPEAASAAAARIAVVPRSSRPAGDFDAGPGFPAWTVTVEKNRDGRIGRVDMEWNSDDRRFDELVPLPLPLAAGDPHRPARADEAGAVLAHPAFARRAS